MRVIVQTHPSRQAAADQLASRFADSLIVVDPDPAGPPSPWRCYRECLVAVGGGPALIIQDDAAPIDGLDGVLDRLRPGLVCLAVQATPMPHVQDMTRAYLRGDPYAQLRLGAWVPVVATKWDGDLAASCVAWADDNLPRRALADDGAIGRWARRQDVTIWATVPSLVDHPSHLPSLVGTKKRPYHRSRFMAATVGEWTG